MARRRHSPQRQQIEAIALQLSIILTVRRCADVAALDAVLDEPLGVDLIVVGSANGEHAATVVEALAAKEFGGKVLLFGPRNSSSVGAVRQLGTHRRLDMLPPLATPFDSTSLHESVTALARKEAQREPMIDATEALDRVGWSSGIGRNSMRAPSNCAASRH